MFVIVGGAIAINWSRDKMSMPAAEPVVAAPMSTEVAEAARTPALPAGGASGRRQEAAATCLGCEARARQEKVGW